MHYIRKLLGEDKQQKRDEDNYSVGGIAVGCDVMSDVRLLVDC